MAAVKPPSKLYIASEDLKERYRGKNRGRRFLKAYVSSVEGSRNIAISIEVKPNGTIEFSFLDVNDSREGLAEAKQDIQGEVCSIQAVKKYEQPPHYLPSAHIKDKKTSSDARREMKKEDQKRLQAKLPKTATLTIEALEEHDRKHTTGPCQLRQFACPQCQHFWWRTILKSKPVSRCRGGRCRNTRYDALPREKEFGIGRFLCPNNDCGRQFFGYCEATEELQCRKCGSSSKPHIHPKWRKRKRKSGLNPGAKSFMPSRPRFTSRQHPGPHFEPVSGGGSSGPFYDTAGRSDFNHLISGLNLDDPPPTSGSRKRSPKQPKIPPRGRRRIFNPSTVHQPTGGTESTFLTQADSQIGEEVPLDYDSDDDDEKVGTCKFECSGCDKEYTVLVRMSDTAPCHDCKEVNRPLTWTPPRDIQSKTNNMHNCSRCPADGGNCPNLGEAKLRM